MTPEPLPEPRLVTLDPQDYAVLRDRVAVGELPGFFSRAFHASAAAAAEQGREVTGPPVGIYHGMPAATIDVAAGFPVDAPVRAQGDVRPHRLPGGRAAQVVHMGDYRSLRQTYDRLFRWVRERNLAPARMMWESYLNEPQPEAPDATRTLVTWPLREDPPGQDTEPIIVITQQTAAPAEDPQRAGS